ncbi:MAG: hypothetical protein ACJ72E_05500 [Marmoricola sp.]
MSAWHEVRARRLRRRLLQAGETPRDLTPAPGQHERMEAALAQIVAVAPADASARTPETTSETTPETTPETVRLQPRRRVWVLAATVAALVAGAVTVPLLLGGTPRAEATTPELLTFDGTSSKVWPRTGTDAQNELATLSRLAATLPYRADLPVQALSVDSWTTTSGAPPTGKVASRLVPMRDDSYYFPDARWRLIEKIGTTLDKGGRIDTRISWATRPVSNDVTQRIRKPGPGYAAGLPTDGTRLQGLWAAQHDRTLCGAFSGGCFLGDLTSLAHTYVIPPAVLSAVWEALAQEPSITYLGTTRDRVGRRAVAFGALAPDKVSQLVVLADPASGAYLGDETVLVHPSPGYSFAPPAVTSFSAVVSAQRIGIDEVPSAR